MSITDPSILARLLSAREAKPKKEPKPIPKQSARAKEKAAEDKKMTALDKEFYAEIWSAAPHKCEECNKNLGREPLTMFFHHVLEKRNYPEYRYLPENIMILCPDHHQQAELDLDKVPKVKARREYLLKTLLQ